ncbi:MAG: chemotaxis protein CheW, partial [Thermodesulfobacteriota bacterium]
FSRPTWTTMIQVGRENARLIIGVIVDEVSEVLEIAADQIEATTELGARVDTDFVMGMAKTESDVKILLDIDRILSEKEMAALQRTG